MIKLVSNYNSREQVSNRYAHVLTAGLLIEMKNRDLLIHGFGNGFGMTLIDWRNSKFAISYRPHHGVFTNINHDKISWKEFNYVTRTIYYLGRFKGD